MDSSDIIEQVLDVQTLRENFLKYTRHAYQMLPKLNNPRILDIGCGTGLPTIELARLSGGEVIGIDPDLSALSQLDRRIEEANLSRQVITINCSLCDTELPDEHFDILWGEGVLHLLDPERSFAQCNRLMKSRGFLVTHETISWFDTVSKHLSSLGFKTLKPYLLPKNCWWTDYYAPLAEKILALRKTQNDIEESAVLTQYESEIARYRTNPGQYDCAYFFIQKR